MIYNFCVYSEKKVRVDIYLSTLFNDFSRSYIQKIIDSWNLSVNWKVVNKNIKISSRDELKVHIIKKSLDKIEPEKIDIDIIYEDNEILIINKDSSINVHPVPWEWGNSNTLVNAILYHCKDNLPSIWWVERPWIVHRLDKDTSWIILIAKTDKMMNYLSEIIKDRKITKNYLAIVYWKVSKDKFRIESYIWRDPNNRLKMTTKNPINPKIAITNAELLWYIGDNYSLLKVNIETWRTHQIRVHLSSIGFPIIWDKVYSKEKINNLVFSKFWLSRQALHAYSLEFDLYWKKQKFIWDLKPDMKKIIWDLKYN